MTLRWRTALTAGGISALLLLSACGAPSAGPAAAPAPAGQVPDKPGAQQSVDAMAVIYTSTMLVLLVVALRFVNPTQLVARVKETPQP